MRKATLFILAAACVFALYIILNREPENQEVYENSLLYTVEYTAASPANFVPIGDDQPISRGMAAKMLALIHKGTAEIYAMERIHPFTDVAPHHWHAPYINAAYTLGIMRGNGSGFMPDAPLTIGQAQTLLHVLDPDNAPTFTNIPELNRPVTYALWVELYKQLLEGLSDDRTIYEAFGIIAKDIIVLATSANSSMPEGHLISDSGPLGHRGLQMDSYIDRQLRVLLKGREIIALDALVSDSPTLKNAYVLEAGQNRLTVFAGGAERIFYWDGGGVPALADIVIHNGRALSVSPVAEVISGTVLRVSYTDVEIKGRGLIPLHPDFKVYDISNGPVRWRSRADIIVGTDSARFYLREDGSAGAGIIIDEAFPEHIRVVIGTSNFVGLIHSSISITGTGGFWITAGDDERLLELVPGQRFTVSDIENTDLLGHPRLFFHTEPGETLQLTGLGRNWPQNSSPRYRGVIEIAKEAGGGYSVINALCLEEYLYAVVPSEMPSAYGPVASKVQAVTARSFAVHQVLANRFHALGGNIDDSVMSQVYNNIPENEISIEAVEATRGLVLWYGGQIVQANFFSTSAGMTANSGEVWAGGGTSTGAAFPGHTPSFLRARSQVPGRILDLSNEARAAAFFRDTEVEAYDSQAPWFRWQLEMTPAEIAASVNAQLAQPIGNLVNLSVLSRGEGGNIMELHIIGDAGDVIISPELNIRRMLRPARAVNGNRDIAIRRHDGSTLLNLNMMPSAFFTFEFHEDIVVFHGGGHGHGVGMSQNGVRGMVERGFTFEEILAHFYPDTVLGDFRLYYVLEP